MKGLYVHVPFCIRKCAYCDFYSLPGRRAYISEYVDAVLHEANEQNVGATLEVALGGVKPRPYDLIIKGMSFQTLYLGGGTPSLLGSDNLVKLIIGLRNTFDLTGLVEATIEVNPESATVSLIKTAQEIGFNRISIGVQSLSDYELKSVGRVHNAAQAIKAIKQAKAPGFDNISCDVIVGLPGQSGQTLITTLETLTALGIRHISMYCLSLEHGTPLALNPPTDLPTDDEQAELFTRASAFLESKGFIHYEISNFALKGFECQHNLNYWRGGEYLGLGPAAASHLSGKRFKNRADLDAYLNDPTGVIEEVEELDAEEKSAEEAMLRLRLLSEGLDINDIATQSGALVSRLNRMVNDGLLTRDGSVYRLPPDRVLTSNPIFARVLGD